MSTEVQPTEETVESVQSWFSTLIGNSDAGDIALLVLKTLGILLVCLLAKRLLLISFSKILSKTRLEQGLRTFLRSVFNILFWLLTIIIVAGSLGISTTPLLAAFSVIGLALTLAVQDSLSNLAGGINILVSKPFVLGDYIEIDADSGTVCEIGMIHTCLQTVDNRRVMLPNSKVMSARVINYSTESLRRVDLAFSVSYDVPIAAVQAAILAMVAQEKRVLAEPAAAVVRVTDYGERGITYSMRAWCSQDDYWELYFDLLERIKPALEQEGLEMSYPNLTVHLRDKSARPPLPNDGAH